MVSSGLSLNRLAICLLSLGISVVGAQDAESSVTGSIAPAATLVSSISSAGVPLFDAETVQLTDEVITNIVNGNDQQLADYAHLFAFENSSAITPAARSRRARRAAKCKTYPGDLLWPSKFIWELFDVVLGGALAPIVPIASPCHKNSIYNNYDAAKCANITAVWGIESMQYVSALHEDFISHMRCGHLTALKLL